MTPRTRAAIHRGIDSALLASVPQVLVPKLEERLFLHETESADLGPRFVDALARRVGQRLPEDAKWIAASAFHFGYATFWGTAYALVQSRVRVSPWLGGLALAGVIHLVAFPRFGAAVLAGSEEHPRRRSWRMKLVFASAPLVFGLATALLYGRGPRRRRW